MSLEFKDLYFQLVSFDRVCKSAASVPDEESTYCRSNAVRYTHSGLVGHAAFYNSSLLRFRNSQQAHGLLQRLFFLSPSGPLMAYSWHACTKIHAKGLPFGV